MKKWLLILLCLLVLSSAVGCGRDSAHTDGVAFYYRTASLSGAGLQAEYREEFKPDDDLKTILRAYILGPETEELVSPFRSEHRVLTATVENDTVFITMSTSFANMQGLELMLACSCLTVTALELTGAQRVSISAEGILLEGQASIVLTRDSLVLSDDSPNLPS